MITEDALKRWENYYQDYSNRWPTTRPERRIILRLIDEVRAWRLAGDNLVKAVPPCRCGPEYKDRGLISPNCVTCDIEDELTAINSLLEPDHG